MSQFYNPFNFVPLNDHPKTDNDHSFHDIGAGKSHVTHQLWHPDTLSGTIFMSITNHSDLIVGSANNQSFFTTHVNGRLGNEKQLAIPANSMRGAVASVAEAISDSAMRVLADESYSVRVPVDEPTSSVGIVRKSADTGTYYIQPVSLPPIKCKDYKFSVHSIDFFPNPSDFDELTWSDYVKFSFEAYAKKGDKLIELTKENIEKHNLNKKAPHILAQKGVELKRFQGMRNKTFFYVKAPRLNVPISKSLDVNRAQEYFEVTDRRVSFLTCQRIKPLNTENVLTESEFEAKGKPDGYIRCILMCLGTEGRETEVANTKKNEYLIPYSEKKHRLISNPRALIRLPDEVVKSFETIVKQTCDSGSFIQPQGWKDIDKKRSEPWKVMGGDLVYFSAKDKNGTLEVTKLSHSQIWRSEVKNKSLHGIVTASGQSRYLPWGCKDRKANENSLTPAEVLFGVVEDRENDKSNASQGLALASRVRFYDGVLLQSGLTTYEKSLTLDSPKPPSPALYLHGKSGQGLGKSDVLKSEEFRINGRKRYLQHQKAHKGDVKTGTEDMLSKVQCLPSSSKPAFGFWIEFDNLTEDELSLLLLSTGATQNGAEHAFKHQLGMGKPYGFGKCELQILTVLLKDAQTRYNSLSNIPNYQHVLKDYEPSPEQRALLIDISQRVEHPGFQTFLKEQKLASSEIQLNHAENKLVNKTALAQVRALADAEQFKNHDITYPLPSGSQTEAKIFEWFGFNEENREREKKNKNARNDRKKQLSAEYQYLGKLRKDGAVKTLKRIRKP